MKVWAPPPKLTVSQWADDRRYLSAESASEPGKWNTSRAEYQRGIMDAGSDPEVHTVVIESSAQVGKTSVIENFIGYHVDQDPCPIMVVQPTVEMAETFSKDRLAPMVRDTPALNGKIKDPKSRDSGNTLSHKTFPGGHITMVGANAPSGLASRPIRVVLLDEVDRYPASAGTEGDPVSLARKRTTTFWNRKIIMVSTPTTAGKSRIEAAFTQSDQRHFFVPCPHCETMQTLKWGQVKWDDGKPETVAYVCEADGCGTAWSDAERWNAVRFGEWRASREFSGIAGFHLNEIYSPWVRLEEMVRAFLEAKDKPEQLKTWVNTSLGETWAEQGEAPDWQRIYDKREDFEAGVVPMRGLLLTAGVDVHPQRIEMSVWAWGRQKQSWKIAHLVFEGAVTQPEVWAQLTDATHLQFRHASGSSMSIQKLAIDSGDSTAQVYDWCRRQRSGQVMAIKGQDRSPVILGQPSSAELTHEGKRMKFGIRLWPVGVSILKSELYGWLKLDAPTDEVLAAGGDYLPGYVHLSKHDTDSEWCKQLVSEHLVTTKDRRGFPRQEWQKLRARNEALDCRVYARAAAEAFGISRMVEGHWRKLERILGIRDRDAEAAPKPAPAPAATQQELPLAPKDAEQKQGPQPTKPKPKGRRVMRSSFMGR